MTALAKATLTELSGDRAPKPAGDPVEVQFNPSSLRLQMTNNVEGGKSTTRPVEQHIGKSSDTLSIELVFDTADEGTTPAPRSVRERTADISKFVRPKEGAKQTPPRVRFHWGDFLFEGVMTSYSEDLDLFASTGVPLRAKVQVSILGQDARFESLASGPGASTGAGATPPGGGAGKAAGGPLDRVATALGGESAPSLAARLGLDPSAWRGMSFGDASPLALSAGLEVGFSASLTASGAIGVRAGVEAGLDLSLEARLGLAAAPAVAGAAGTSSAIAAPAGAGGAALAAAGGIGAAVEQLKIGRSQAAAAQALAAFAAPGATAAAVASVATIAVAPRPAPLRAGAEPSATVRGQAPPAPPAPRADVRAVSFGLGIPLRARVSGAERSHEAADGRVVVGVRAPSIDVAVTSDPTVAPWRVLPAAHDGRTTADAAQRLRRPPRPCGCGAGVGCGCGCGDHGGAA